MSVVFARPGYMAADRRCTNEDGWEKLPSVCKITRFEGLLVGAIGLAQNCYTLSAAASENYSRSVSDIIELIYNPEEPSEILIASEDELHYADSHGQVTKVREPYWVIGSGVDYVRGYLRSNYGDQLVPHNELVLEAIRQCADWRLDVGDGVDCQVL